MTKSVNASVAAAAVVLVWMSVMAGGAAELGRSAPPTVRSAGGGLGGNPATGLQLAICNPAQIFPENYDVSGFRFNLIYGLNSNLRGFDLGLVNDVTGVVEGLQLGIANRADDLSGLQFGVYNSANSSAAGCCQIGLVNMGKDVNGVQIGLFNMCDTISGVQIGLLNFITQSDFVIFCPLVNAQF